MSVEPAKVAEHNSKDVAQRAKWTEIEIEFLRKASNRDFQKWLNDRQGKSLPVVHI
jgi:hypothetical protein